MLDAANQPASLASAPHLYDVLICPGAGTAASGPALPLFGELAGRVSVAGRSKGGQHLVACRC